MSDEVSTRLILLLPLAWLLLSPGSMTEAAYRLACTMRKRKVEVDPVDAELDVMVSCCAHSHPDICWSSLMQTSSSGCALLIPASRGVSSCEGPPHCAARARQHHRQPTR
jgi:hypothetical protein